MTTNRTAAFREALSSQDPLGAIRKLIPNDGKDEQQVVVYAYACILETNSAGLSILFDRYEDNELHKIDSALERIGASGTRADLRKMMATFQQALESGQDRREASESLERKRDIRKLDKKYLVHVEEMERQLLAFCKQNVNELALG